MCRVRLWPVNSAVRFRPPDRLSGFAVHQQIPEDDRSAMAKAIGRASEASTVAFTIGICFLLGYWLDYSLKTSPLFSVIGLALGMITAFLQLLKLALQSLLGICQWVTDPLGKFEQLQERGYHPQSQANHRK